MVFATITELEMYGPVWLREYLARRPRRPGGGQVVEFTREGQ